MISKAQIDAAMQSFIAQAAVITGDQNCGVSLTPQPAPLLAIVMIAWRPRGDAELPYCSMVRKVERDPTGAMQPLEQLEGYLTIMLAELERAANRPTIH